MNRSRKPRELTGRAVLLWLVGFFAVIFAVNGWLVQAATSTFGGLETASSYQAGRLFENEVERAGRQEDLRWHVDGRLTRDSAGEAVLDVTVRDEKGAPVDGLTADATLEHPANARYDHAISLTEVGEGAFHGETRGQSGQWELVIDLYRGGERVFRSKSRVTLR